GTGEQPRGLVHRIAAVLFDQLVGRLVYQSVRDHAGEHGAPDASGSRLGARQPRRIDHRPRAADRFIKRVETPITPPAPVRAARPGLATNRQNAPELRESLE